MERKEDEKMETERDSQDRGKKRKMSGDRIWKDKDRRAVVEMGRRKESVKRWTGKYQERGMEEEEVERRKGVE